MAAYILTFAILNRKAQISLVDCCFAVSIGLLIWSIFAIINRSASSRFTHRIFMCIPPSVILLTVGDREAFSKFTSRNSGDISSFVSVIIVIITSIGLNIVSSYLYDYITKVH